jgi:membrane protein DedA with SNARE-associated domain
VNDWIIQLVEQSGYLGVGFLMFLETVFPPIPSEVIMSVAGLAASRGHLDIVAVIASGTTGAMLGNMFWYFAARVIGIERFKPLILRFGRFLTLDWAEIERAEKLFGTQGWAIVFFGRMLPTLRSLVSIPAGLLEMRLSTFTFWSTVGTAGWTALIAFAGWKLGKEFAHVEDYVGPLSTTIVVVIVMGYVWRLFTWKPGGPSAD